MHASQSLRKKATLFMIGMSCFLLILFVFLPVGAFAQVTQGLDTVQETSGLTDTSLVEIIGNIIKVILSLSGVVLLVLVIYAGFLWMTSRGDADRIKKAKDIIINAVIGLVIVLSSYAITTFVINAITGALDGTGGSSSASSSTVSIERLSGSLGVGGLSDHYPARNATDIARNSKIFVTFKDAMDIEAFIDGYDTAGTPEDVSDDTIASALNTSNVKIYPTAEGDGAAFSAEEVEVSFTDDLKTFTFTPPLLGSDAEDVSYTVFLDDGIERSDGEQVLNDGGYEWSFEVGTEIDLVPPSVVSVVPTASSTYDRNIIVEITFSEAVDPTSASGVRTTSSGFDNIQVVGASGSPTAGSYVISNEYKTVTFTSNDPCGTNSCGQTIYCLPGGQTVTVTALAPTIGSEPPQASVYPYDGIVDPCGNGLDANGDGEAGDDYSWSFTTTNDISLAAPEIDIISPNISEEDVALDQEVLISFDGFMMSSTFTSSSEEESRIDLLPNPSHEMWYSISMNYLDISGADTEVSGGLPVASQAEISHGVFLESIEGGVLYKYISQVGEGVKNQYQNCFSPGEGPTISGGRCGTTTSYPYCCNGVASTEPCAF